MESAALIVILVIALSLFFDFTNGFHDTANAMATPIATGALKPKVAVLLAAGLNLVGAFLSTEVSKTISHGIIREDQITPAELLPNPAALIRNGWTRARSQQALNPGTPIKITIAPPRAGGMVGLLVKMTDMNGTELLKDDGLPPPPDNSLSAQPQPAKP